MFINLFSSTSAQFTMPEPKQMFCCLVGLKTECKTVLADSSSKLIFFFKYSMCLKHLISLNESQYPEAVANILKHSWQVVKAYEIY